MKKLIRKLAPKGISRFLLRRKYEGRYAVLHSENIRTGRVVSPVCGNPAQASLLRGYLDDTFAGTVSVDGTQVHLREAAIIRVPSNYEQYLDDVGPKTRNMIRKAERSGVVFREFDWNERLDDIYEINRSSETRQGHRMTAGYRNYPERVDPAERSTYGILHIGGFVGHKLVAYVEMYVCGNFAFVNRILGHKEYLNTGVMNGLVAASVRHGMKNGIDYINYLMMEDREHDTLSGFKYRVGFRPFSVLTVTSETAPTHVGARVASREHKGPV